MKTALFLLAASGLSLIFSCTHNMSESITHSEGTLPDAHSFAGGSTARVIHEQLDLQLDFTKKILSGAVTITLTNPEKEDSVFLDTRDLKILSVENAENHFALDYSLSAADPVLGQALKIKISGMTSGKILIRYETRPEAAALQWLEPEQTSGKKLPMLFTQGQAILSRTWFPCQDSPGIRFLWSASIRAPENIRPLMSAEKQSRKGQDYFFEMTKPVPAYLIALAAGNFEFRELDNLTGVYAEPEVLEKAASEFSAMPGMLKAAESLYGKYRWGRYDVLVLPPSFPFGGMENPCLTFATPTILAGDRSLVSLIAHELAHSWSGNLVTNETWNDFWLNEGFTVYFERRIMEALEGRAYSDMLAAIGYGDLENTLHELGIESADTRLLLDLKGRDADEGMTDIAYEKGYLFLCSIEKKTGRKNWDAFLKKYFENHAFRSINTEKFLEYLDDNLLKNNNLSLNDLNVSGWVYGSGLPAGHEKPESARFRKAEEVAAAVLKGNLPADSSVTSWSSHEWLHFLRILETDLNADLCRSLDERFRFSRSGNSEILFQWLLSGLKCGYEPAWKGTEEFLMHTGRRKFVLPLYKEMARSPSGMKTAQAIFSRASRLYHPVTRISVENCLSSRN